MADPKFDLTVHVGGAGITEEALDAMTRRVNGATKRGLRSVQALTRQKIRGGMRAAPRSDHRGAWKKKGRPAFKLDEGKGTRRSGRGGPGYLTGELYSSIRKSKRPRNTPAGVSAVVFAGGKGGWQNMYKRKIEGQYPYFAVGVKKAMPKIPGIWEKEWARATRENSKG